MNLKNHISTKTLENKQESVRVSTPPVSIIQVIDLPLMVIEAVNRLRTELLNLKQMICSSLKNKNKIYTGLMQNYL